MNNIKILVTVIILMLPLKSHADSQTIAHVAVSAGLTTGLYLFMSRVTGKKKESLGASVAISLAAGFAIEVGDSITRGDRRIDMGDMAANALGVGIATGFIYFLDIKNMRPHPNGIAMEF